MTTLTQKEILANRQKVIAFLKNPERRKATEVLDQGGDYRCCLGHMSYALNVKKTTLSGDIAYGEKPSVGLAPRELVDLVGLGDRWGTITINVNTEIHPILEKFQRSLERRIGCLTELNDETEATPQEIGAYLEDVINGGPGSPWKHISEYS